MVISNRAFAALTAFALVLLLGLSVVLSSVNLGLTAGPAGNARISATNNFDQLVVVLMENKNLNEVYGPATYMTQLADQYSFAQHWASITNPSQPNYIAIMGASTFGVSGDGNHPQLNHPTLVDLIESSGHTWKAYAEGAGGSGCGLNPPRGEDHFPFLSYTTITGSPARCANLLGGGPPEVVAALNAGTNFIWFTPTDGHNMHDNSVASGDSWLQGWVPGLLSAMAGKKAALIIMFDEAYSPKDIYMSFSGPATKLAYKSSASYTHYSLAKLLEDVWGGGSLGQGDVGAASPLEFFGAGGPVVPDFSIAANPGSVSFVSGQSATSTVSVQSTGGFAGTVALTTASSPAGLAASCSPASVAGGQSSTCTLTATTIGSYTATVTGTSGSLVHSTSISVSVTVTPPPGGGPPGGPPPGGRDALLWPFSPDSIWNLPIGASAVYVPATIQAATQRGMTTDPDVLILTPNATMTAVYFNSDGWTGASRCAAQGAVLFQAPIPSDFVVPGATPTDTPNHATAILLADGHTLIQGQPFARCASNGDATMTWSVSNDLYGTGIAGGHGRSGMSSIGGTIRLGELVPGGVIRHAMKINLFGQNNYYYDTTTLGYRWPANQAGSCAATCFGGTTQALRMGSLLAIPASVTVDSLGLETDAAKILAQAFQDYGAYAVDDTAWSVYAIETEFSPQGRVEDEFTTAWGFAIDPATKNVPWARDMDRIFGALAVVDNWDEAQWNLVSVSDGTQGVGGGTPRVPWAPGFGTGSGPGPVPQVPAEWITPYLYPAIAFAAVGVTFAVWRRHAKAEERARQRRRRPASRSRRNVPVEDFDDATSEF